MQDGARQGAAAGEWLKEHFAGEPALDIDITWDPRARPDQGAYERLLEILFSPRSDTPAA